jgi:hypothetical protein
MIAAVVVPVVLLVVVLVVAVVVVVVGVVAEIREAKRVQKRWMIPSPATRLLLLDETEEIDTK